MCRTPEITKPRCERGNVGAVYGAESNGSEYNGKGVTQHE